MAEPLITAAQLHAIMPLAGARADVFAPVLADVMLFRQINTPTRIAAFLAQVGHESGQLRMVRELWGPTPVQRRYDGRADLGNTNPEAIRIARAHGSTPGRWWLGRGLIQTTGYTNNLACGQALGLDLLNHPELLEQPTNAAASAAWFWLQRSLNRYADRGDFLGLSVAINGKNKDGLPNGWQDRQDLWDRAKKALGMA
ncbi:glycoside hydrolase family 19 protein [Ralstonia pseudosolanacearum]|uniref:glycoside hydrolase family 19 protein n=1 Tax=Ralstonia pseudosolanacearum TaxID=1310165 RepID=UPI003EDF6E1C